VGLNTDSRGGSPYSGLYGEAPRERHAFIKNAVYKRVEKIAILVYKNVTKSAANSCKVEEMVAKAKYIKGGYSLAEMSTQLNQND